MDKKETQTKARELLNSGIKKSEVFAQLSGQGIKDSQLANLIASYADQNLCREHKGKVYVLISIMLFQAFIAFLVDLGSGSDIGSNSKWLFGALNAIIPLLFAFGFYKHYAGAYNAYLVFYILQLPKTLKGIATNPVATYVFLAIYIGADAEFGI